MTRELSIDPYAGDVPDAETIVLADYIGGFLSEADEKRFEQRMVDDEEFFLRMAPFLTPFYDPELQPVEREIRDRIEARAAIAAHLRAAEVDIPRSRRTKGLVAAAASVAFQVKIAALLATATAAGVMVAYRLERPVASAPQQIFVQLPPKVIHDTVPRVVAQSEPAHIDHHTIRTHHVPVTDAGQPIDVIPLPTPVDSAMERAVAEMVARALPEGGVTPSTTTKPGETGPQVAWVPHIWVEVDTTHSVLRTVKNKLVSGAHGALAAIANSIGDILHPRSHHGALR